jgi:hypothetical protein
MPWRPTLTQSEQALMFSGRAKAFEEKATQECDWKQKETLLDLAQQYRHLAEQSKNGPYD